MKGIVISCVMFGIGYSTQGESNVMRMAVIPSGEKVLRCTMTNRTDKVIRVTDYFLEGDNNVYYEILSETDCFKTGGVGPDLDWDPPAPLQLLSGQHLEWFVDKDDFHRFYQMCAGLYMRCRWDVYDFSSPCIVLGFDEQTGSMRLPIRKIESANTNSVAYCAFVLSESGTNSINLIYEALACDGRIIQDGRISVDLLISTCDKKFTKRITVFPRSKRDVIVRGKRIVELRIPWDDIKKSLNPKELGKLQMSGDFDLRWRWGNLVSAPLPMWIGSRPEGANASQ